MAHAGRLGQPGRAGGVDQQRPVGDRHRRRSAPRAAAPEAPRSRGRCDISAVRRPRARDQRRAGTRALRDQRIAGKARVNDHVLRRRDVEAMGERGAAQPGVDQCNDNTDVVTPSQIARYSALFRIISRPRRRCATPAPSAQRA